jgi:hypothetical protein
MNLRNGIRWCLNLNDYDYQKNLFAWPPTAKDGPAKPLCTSAVRRARGAMISLRCCQNVTATNAKMFPAKSDGSSWVHFQFAIPLNEA